MNQVISALVLVAGSGTIGTFGLRISSKHSTKMLGNSSGVSGSWANLGKTMYFVRHGESAWNVAEHAFKKDFWLQHKNAMGDACSAVGDGADDVTKSYCNAKINQAAMMVHTGRMSTLVNSDMKKAAEQYINGREMVDAPLTVKGLSGAKEFSEIMSKKLAHRIPRDAPFITSNLIRAADTLTGCFASLLSGDKKIIVDNSLQEYSQSGNPDPVAGVLPGLLSTDGRLSMLAKSSMEFRRRECKKFGRCKGLDWYKAHVENPGDHQNINKYHSNDNLWQEAPDNVREKPAGITTTVLSGDYPESDGSVPANTLRFSNFIKLLERVKGDTVVVAGHSNWFLYFMKWMIANNMVDSSCKPLAENKKTIDNVAMVSIKSDGTCACEYPGQSKADEAKRGGPYDDASKCWR